MTLTSPYLLDDQLQLLSERLNIDSFLKAVY